MVQYSTNSEQSKLQDTSTIPINSRYMSCIIGEEIDINSTAIPWNRRRVFFLFKKSWNVVLQAIWPIYLDTALLRTQIALSWHPHASSSSLCVLATAYSFTPLVFSTVFCFSAIPAQPFHLTSYTRLSAFSLFPSLGMQSALLRTHLRYLLLCSHWLVQTSFINSARF
jgi:hypothetical protein